MLNIISEYTYVQKYTTCMVITMQVLRKRGKKGKKTTAKGYIRGFTFIVIFLRKKESNKYDKTLGLHIARKWGNGFPLHYSLHLPLL